MKKITIKVSKEDLKKKLNIRDGVDGKTPIAGVDFPLPKDGKNGVDGQDAPPVDTENIVLEASNKALEALKPLIPTIQSIEQDIPKLGAEIRDSLELLQGDDRLDKSAIKGLEDYFKTTFIGGGSTARNLYQLMDVSISSPTNNQVLKYNSTTGLWENGSAGSSLAIGNAVTGGNANDILYIDASGNLAQDDGFTWTTTVLGIDGDIHFADKVGGDRIIKVNAQSVLDTNGNPLGVLAGNGNGTGQGGDMYFQGGYDGSGNSQGANVTAGGGTLTKAGDFTAAGGNHSGNVDPGDVYFLGGEAGSGNHNGGNITFIPGRKVGSGVEGKFKINNRQSGINAVLDTSGLATSDKTFTFPNDSGMFVVSDGNIADNSIVRGDGGATGVQQSLVSIDDSGNVTGGYWAGTAVSVQYGGTGRNSLTLGQILYGTGSSIIMGAVAANTTTTKMFLSQTGDGVNSAAPVWDTVTKSDVGLGNVENTALSTWAGSTNLTTLGTITTGTWTGTTIALANGGTGASLSDPGANTLMGWDDTDNAVAFFTIGTGLTYTHATHTLSGNTGTVTSVASADGSITVTNPTTTVDLSVVKAPILTTARNIWGQSFNGSADVTGSLTSVGDITGGANNMTITAGTGASRVMALRTTTSGSVAATFLQGNADQSTTFFGNVALGTNNLTLTGSIGATGARVTKGWFTDLEVTNAIVGSITGNAATVTVADETTDTTSFIGFYTAATGSLGGKTNTNMTFNASTGVATFASTVLTTTDINGGTIDGATIGATSATTIVGTTITGNSFIPNSSTIPSNGMYLPAVNTLGWAINSAAELQLTGTALSPAADGGSSLGTTALGWQNLFGNTGFVLNIENGDWVATHTTGILTVGTGDLRVTTAGTNTASVVTVGGTQSLTNKKLGSLTTNGYIKTSGGDGTLSVQAVPIPIADGGTNSTTALSNQRVITSVGGAYAESGAISDGDSIQRNNTTFISAPIALVAEGRLTLTSGTAVTTSDVTGATTIYFTPYKGDRITVYDGTRWKIYSFSEVSLALGTLVNAQAYDVFIFDSSGTLTLETAEWKNATVTISNATPAVVTWTTHGLNTGDSITFTTGGSLPTGVTANTQYYITKVDANTFKLSTTLINLAAGTFVNTSSAGSGTHTGHQPQARQTAITLQNGMYVKSGTTTRLYLGTFFTTATTTTEDSVTNRYVWNYFNRVQRKLLKVESTASWTSATNGYEAWNGSAANRVGIINGVAETMVDLTFIGNIVGNNVSNPLFGIGVNSVSTNSSDLIQYGSALNTASFELTTTLNHYPVVGYVSYQLLQNPAGTSTTFRSTNSIGASLGVKGYTTQ